MLSLVSASVSVYSAVIGGVLFSVVSQIVVAMTYGAGEEVDALYGAQTLPILAKVIFTSGSVFILVPAFIGFRERGGNKDARQDIGEILLTLSLGILFINFLICIFADVLIQITCPGFTSQQHLLAVKIVYLEAFSTVCMGVALLVTSLHHIKGSFAAASFCATFPTIGVMLGSLLLSGPYGIFGLVIGEATGAFVWMMFLLPIVGQKGEAKLPAVVFSKKALRTYALMAPFVLFAFLQNSNVLIDRYFASSLGEGKIAYLTYSLRLSTVLSNILASGIAVVLYPTISVAVARSNFDDFKKYLSLSIKIVGVISIPVVLTTLPACLNIVQVLFERGKFTAQDSMGLLKVMPFYLLSAGLMALGQVIARGFYALKDTWTPLWLGVAGVMVYCCSCKVLIPFFDYTGIGLSFLFYWMFTIGGLGILLRRKVGCRGKGVVLTMIRALGAATPTALGNYLTIEMLDLHGKLGILSTVGWIMVYFFITSFAVGIEEVKVIRARACKFIGAILRANA